MSVTGVWTRKAVLTANKSHWFFFFVYDSPLFQISFRAAASSTSCSESRFFLTLASLVPILCETWTVSLISIALLHSTQRYSSARSCSKHNRRTCALPFAFAYEPNI